MLEKMNLLRTGCGAVVLSKIYWAQRTNCARAHLIWPERGWRRCGTVYLSLFRSALTESSLKDTHDNY
jgi:hypothetical protein